MKNWWISALGLKKLEGYGVKRLRECKNTTRYLGSFWGPHAGGWQGTALLEATTPSEQFFFKAHEAYWSINELLAY